MIDTINFKLNNVSKYQILKTQYERTTRTGETTVIVDDYTGEIATNTKIRAILHHDSDNLIPLSKRSTIFIASSHYSVSYFYNVSQDFVDFNLSVPKYMYGTNIIQFISYFSQDAETCYKMLIEFVRNFANKHFIEKIDFADLELTRLDLCYNQFFNSKLDALTYLNKQKELLKKHARSTKNDYRSYETSLLYITKRYSFKIYHKGTEFRKNDRRELSKKNPTGHQIDDLQEISDKVLRYEITFRKAQINYLYEKAELYKNYIPYKTESELYFCRTLNRNLYERIVEFSTQSKHFIFAGISDDDALRLNTVAFSQAIFIEMYNYFWETVKKYQLGVKLSLFDVIKRIDEKNKEKQDIKDPRLREKLSYHKPTLSLLATLAQYESVDDIQKSGIFSRAQFYRYKKKLAELGISSENILTEMPPPALDFVDYKYYFSKHHIK